MRTTSIWRRSDEVVGMDVMMQEAQLDNALI